MRAAIAPPRGSCQRSWLRGSTALQLTPSGPLRGPPPPGGRNWKRQGTAGSLGASVAHGPGAQAGRGRGLAEVAGDPDPGVAARAADHLVIRPLGWRIEEGAAGLALPAVRRPLDGLGLAEGPWRARGTGGPIRAEGLQGLGTQGPCDLNARLEAQGPALGRFLGHGLAGKEPAPPASQEIRDGTASPVRTGDL